MIYEQKLCETLNKIIAKLNFEKSEADHCVIQQKIEVEQQIKLKQTLKMTLRKTKKEVKNFYRSA